MKLFQRRFVLFYISTCSLLWMPISSFGQYTMDISSSGEDFAVGLRENHSVFIQKRILNAFYLTAHSSLYTEDLLKQIFRMSLYQQIQINSFTLRPRLFVGGKYSDGIHSSAISLEMAYALNNHLLVNLAPILTYFERELEPTFEAGFYVNVYRERISYFIKFHPDLYFFNDENHITNGFFISEGRLNLEVGIQAPQKINLKYSRLVTSFIYKF